MDNGKRILIVCKAFYPENSPRSFRATELAKEFSRQGHDVTVLTNDKQFDYSGFLIKHPVTLRSFGKLVCKPLNKSTWELIGDYKRKFGRLLFMLFDYPNIEIMLRLKKALRVEKEYDLMISIAVPYPVHWGIAWAKAKNSPIAKTWIADCGDPFMGNKLESFRYPFYFSFLEKWFCRKADFLTIPTSGAIHGYYPEFHDKIKVIPQGFNFDEIKLSEKPVHNLIPTFGYAGGVSFTGVRSPVKLIDYLVSRGIPYRFHIYSNTGKSVLKEYISGHEENIILHDSLPRPELLLELSTMDFLVNLDNGTSMQLPSKLIDYALTHRPILNINPEMPEFSIIDAFLTGNYEQQYIVKDLHQYNINNVVNEFLKLSN
jgi:hypothetical protein